MKLSDVIGAVLAMGLTAAGAADQQQPPVKIGVLTDMTSIYAEHAGPGSVEAARMAIEDFGAQCSASLSSLFLQTIGTTPASA